MVLPRVLTALVLAPVFLAVLHFGGWPFLIFMTALIFLGLWEFQGMAEAGGHPTQGAWGLLGGALVLAAIVFPGLRTDAPFRAQAPAAAAMAAFALFVFREMARRDKSASMLRLAMSLTGLGAILWPLSYFMQLRELRGAEELFPAGYWAALWLVALVWSQDTAAWAVGRSLGKHRLAPDISPKKSWEGAVAGLLAAVGASLALREGWMQPLFSRGEALWLAVVVGALAQASDLAESLMKRSFGVKDSSALLPGHGGILDRFDAFLLSAPFLYFYLLWTGRAS